MSSFAPFSLLYPQQETLVPTQSPVNGPALFNRLLSTTSRQTLGQLGASPHVFGYTQMPLREGYLYQIQQGTTSTLGVLCQLNNATPLTTHEETLVRRVDYFAHYLQEVRLQAEPVVVMHDHEEAHQFFQTWVQQRPPDCIRVLGDTHHRLWALDEATMQNVSAFFDSSTPLHLADGHHRYASFKKAQQQQQWRGGLFSFLVHHSDLTCASFDWGLPHLPEKTLAALRQRPQSKAVAPNISFRGDEWTLAFDCPNDQNPARYITENLLDNQATDWEYFPPDAAADPRAVDVMISFRPLRYAEITATALAGEVLPPKSTYFTPKLPCGLFLLPMG